MSVRWTPAATFDLLSAHDYIAQFNPSAAANMVRRLESAAESLQQFPQRGRRGDQPGTREFVAVRPYVLVYRVGERGVEILRVWHGAQDRSSES